MSEVQTTLRLNDQASPTLQKVANSARQTASAMQQTGRAIDQAFRSNAPNTFASQASGALRGVLSSAEALGNTIANLFDGADMNEFGSEFDAKFQEASTAAAEFQETIRSAGDVLDEVSDSAEELGDNLNDIGDGGSGLDNVGDDARQAGQEMEQASGSALNLGNALKTMAAAIGVAKIAGEVKQFVSDSISLGTGYSAMMSEVAAISGATGAEYDMLANTAREYGATTVFSASEAAEALKYMSLAGWDANQSASALGGVLNLAAASGMGLGQASDMVTDYLSAFGMEANQAGYFADMLAYAQANSNTSAEQLGQAYLNSAANLHAAGQDIETTTSLLEAMANQGTKGSRAGTQLAAITRDITNSMEDGAIKIGKTSVAVQDQYGNFRDLTDILVDVESAVDGMGSAERAAALAETFTADSTKGVNQILTEGMDNIIRYEEELRRSSGAAEDAADIMNDNLKGDMANMNSAFEEMQLQVFESLEGNLREGAQYVTSTIIPALTEWVPEAIGTVGDAIAKIGSALEPLFKVLLQNPKAVGTALATVGGGLAAIKAVTVGGNIATAITNMGGISGALSKLGGVLVANHWAAGAAALVAGIIAIKGAADIWNDIQIEKSLSRNFGDIELTDAQIQEVAGGIVGVDWVANINLAVGEFENAQEFHDDAEQKLRDNEAIVWEAGVQTRLKAASGGYVQEYIDTVSELLIGRQDSSGLTYDADVITTLEPSEDATSLSGMLIDAINAAIEDPSSDELDSIVGKVVAELGIEDEDGAKADLLGLVNGIVSGASADELNPYIDDLMVELEPQEGDTFLQALGNTIKEMSTPGRVTIDPYKDKITVELTPEMVANYKQNIEDFITDKTQELGSLSKGAAAAIEGVLGNKAGDAMWSQVQTWAAEDSAELENLSSSLTTLVNNALMDGVLDVEEQAAIDILQKKINNIFSTAAQEQADAEWAALETRWNGKDITADSFVSILQSAQEQRQTAMEALDETTVSMYAEFQRWYNNGHLGEVGSQAADDALDGLISQWDYAYLTKEGEAIGRSISFATGKLMSKQDYADLVERNIQSIADNGGGSTLDTLNQLAAGVEQNDWSKWGDVVNGSLLDMNRNFYSDKGAGIAFGLGKEADYGAMQEMYTAMIPDVNDMRYLMDQFKEKGQQVPKALTDSFNEAIRMGAAVGDQDAAWDYYAKQVLDNGSEDLKAAFKDATLDEPVTELGQQLKNQMAPELADAIERAFYAAENEVEDVDLAGIFDELLNLDNVTADLDLGRLNELLNAVGMDISDYIDAQGGLEIEANGMKMNFADFDADAAAQQLKTLSYNGTFETDAGELVARYTVNQQDTMSGIAEQLGVTLDELKASNQHILEQNGSWDLIYPGDVIYNPVADGATSAENTGNAVAEATEAAQAAADAEDATVTKEVTQDTTITAGETDASGAYAGAQAATDEEFSTPLPTDGTTDVTLDETDNVPEVYNTVGTKVETAFSAGYNAAATVHVTLTADYSLANPTKTIEFSGGASGSATVTATLHALGGYFDQAHLGMVAEDGPEYIIPMDGSDRSRDMWAEAGSMLGVVDKPIETMPGGSGNGARGATEATGGSKDINLNINGSGAMRITANVSPEDVLNVVIENIKDVLMDVIQNDILVEGDGVYEY